jgi:hypothetical protein
MKIKFENIGGNDLGADFECTCPHKMFKDNEALRDIMKTRIYLFGYNDSYFFNMANKTPREFKCECGKKYTQQWFKDGYVEIKEVNN